MLLQFAGSVAAVHFMIIWFCVCALVLRRNMSAFQSLRDSMAGKGWVIGCGLRLASCQCTMREARARCAFRFGKEAIEVGESGRGVCSEYEKK